MIQPTGRHAYSLTMKGARKSDRQTSF